MDNKMLMLDVVIKLRLNTVLSCYLPTIQMAYFFCSSSKSTTKYLLDTRLISIASRS